MCTNLLAKANYVPMKWAIYIIEASDSRLYTGISTDVNRRWQEHMTGKTGAKFFRGRQPKQLVYCEAASNRSVASQREAEIKKLSRSQKLALIDNKGKQTAELLALFASRQPEENTTNPEKKENSDQ